jgi:citrate synthase
VFDKDIINQFTELVDDLILRSENDAKFAEIIKWVDVQSQKNRISFYEMVYIITDKQLTKKRAQQWLSEKMHSYEN